MFPEPGMSRNDSRLYADERKKISQIVGDILHSLYISITRAYATKTNKVGLGST